MSRETDAITIDRGAGVRPGFTTITPYLMVADVEPLIAFIKGVFDAEETHRSTGGAGGIHCELRIGDSMLMVGGGAALTPRLCGLHVYVEDVDTAYQRALEAGATSLGGPAHRPYGERAGFVKDPTGNHWYIATHEGPTYFAEGPRTVTPHLHVQTVPAKGGSEFIEFLKGAFGARVELRHDSPAGTIMNAVLRIEEAALEIGESRDAVMAAPAAFYLYVTECDAIYERAIDAGAKPVYAPADQPYGDRMGGVADPWGNEWFIATHLAKNR